jgi:hypothetical protein
MKLRRLEVDLAFGMLHLASVQARRGLLVLHIFWLASGEIIILLGDNNSLVSKMRSEIGIIKRIIITIIDYGVLRCDFFVHRLIMI